MEKVKLKTLKKGDKFVFEDVAYTLLGYDCEGWCEIVDNKQKEIQIGRWKEVFYIPDTKEGKDLSAVMPTCVEVAKDICTIHNPTPEQLGSLAAKLFLTFKREIGE